jgi:hypothetical protein
VVVFYLSVAVTVLATFGLLPWYLSLASIATVFLAILAIASSPTYLALEGDGLFIERTRFLVTRRKAVPPSSVKGLRVVESRRSREWSGGQPPERDISYFIRVDLLTDEGAIRAYRSALTSPPPVNRAEALRVAGKLSEVVGVAPEHLLR